MKVTYLFVDGSGQHEITTVEQTMLPAEQSEVIIEKAGWQFTGMELRVRDVDLRVNADSGEVSGRVILGLNI